MGERELAKYSWVYLAFSLLSGFWRQDEWAFENSQVWNFGQLSPIMPIYPFCFFHSQIRSFYWLINKRILTMWPARVKFFAHLKVCWKIYCSEKSRSQNQADVFRETFVRVYELYRLISPLFILEIHSFMGSNLSLTLRCCWILCVSCMKARANRKDFATPHYTTHCTALYGNYGRLQRGCLIFRQRLLFFFSFVFLLAS